MAHILIVEDYSDTRDLTELILVDAGYHVICANDGFAGLHCALHGQPDLILMDLNLPRLDGWQATRCLKGSYATRHIPVIAYTAYTSDESCRRALQAGCETVIMKPFDIDQFLATVAEVLANHNSGGLKRTVSSA